MIDHLIDNFDLLANAPNGVPELRNMILKLAVQGKLIPQNSNDRPASELLKEIKVQKEKLVKEGKIKKQKPLPQIEADEIPYNIPKNWKWFRLGEIVNIETGKRMKGGAKNEGIISLGGEHLRPEGNVDYSVPRFITEDYFQKMPTGKIQLYDTLMVKDGATTGKTAFVDHMPQDGKAAINEHVFIIRTICSIEKKLLFHFIRTLANEYIKSKSKGIIGGVGRTVISNLYFPLPPLAEQKRIVTKVDQLMALCDELESKQQEHHEKLLSTNSACLYSLTTASTKTQPVAEQRLFNHFDKLYTHPQTITDLKKTILQLAVQGKLVPQDPNDEPAAMLLERIKKKRQKKLPPIGFDEYPYELPKAWEWVRLGNVVDQRLGKMLDKQKNRGEPRPYLRNANVRWFSFDLSDLLEMRVEDNEFKDVSVTKGDLVICEGGEPGRTAIWESDKPMVIQKALHRVRPLAGVFNRFLGYIIRADADSGRLEKIFTGATIKHLTGRALVQHLIPFPPFAEQKRIVTKVDQLMALCDELETKLTHANEDVELFAASTVYHLCDWTSNQEVAS